jgi:membrane protein required for colicin V production
VLLLAVATAVALTPAAKSPPGKQSHGARWLAIARHGLMPLLPRPPGASPA